MAMETRLKEAHLICRRGMLVQEQADGTFLTGYWLIKPEHIREGVVFALHESKAAQSYLQGEVVRLTNIRTDRTPSGRHQRRVEVLVRKSRTPLSWKGGGTGEKGLVWG